MRPMSASELEAEREAFHRELMRKSMRIAELERELEAAEARFANSLTFRLTKPARVGYHLIKGVGRGRR
jgi:hypothetical protein